MSAVAPREDLVRALVPVVLAGLPHCEDDGPTPIVYDLDSVTDLEQDEVVEDRRTRAKPAVPGDDGTALVPGARAGLVSARVVGALRNIHEAVGGHADRQNLGVHRDARNPDSYGRAVGYRRSGGGGWLLPRSIGRLRCTGMRR